MDALTRAQAGSTQRKATTQRKAKGEAPARDITAPTELLDTAAGSPATDEAAETYGIGALAEAFGLTTRTLRHYEDEGLLAPRRRGTQRLYSHRDRARLALICRGKRLGFSLAEIKAFLGLYDRKDGQREQMRFLHTQARERIAALEQQRRDIDATLAELHVIRDEIDSFLATKAR